MVLAACTVVFSIFLTPAWPWLESYLSGEKAELHPGLLIQPALLVSFVLVAAGIAAAAWFYRRAGRQDPLESAAPALFRVLEHKLWIDEFYAATVLKWSAFAAQVSSWLDRFVWDGIVRAIGGGARFAAAFASNMDEGGINLSVDQGCEATQQLGRSLGRRHSGQIQTYLRAVGLGMLALLILYAWLA